MAGEPQHSLPSPGDEPQRPERDLPARRRTLHGYLSGRGKAGDLYLDAITVLETSALRRRVEVAAYALREMMAELEKSFSITKPRRELKKVAEALSIKWAKAKEGPDAEATAARLLDEFVADAEATEQSYRDRAQLTIEKLDSAGVPSPPEVDTARVEGLIDLKSPLDRILHGSKSMSQAEFKEHFRQLEDLLLTWLRPRTFDDIAALDSLIEAGPAEGSEKVRHLVRLSAASYDYFFNGIGSDPGWLEVLVAADFFKRPMEVQAHGDGYVSYPYWAESRYLVRVAPLAPEQVFKIAMSIGQAGNVRVHEDMLLLAAELPASMAATIARREARWLRAQDGHLMSLPQRVPPLLVHLAESGEIGAAFTLLGALLAVSPSDQGGRRKAQMAISDYELEQIITEVWPTLEKVDAHKAFEFLCWRLAEVVEIGFRDAKGDYSYIWRPAIASHRENLGNSIFDTLIDAIRDRSLAISADVDGYQIAIGELQKHESPIFRRLEMCLSANTGPADEVARLLATQDLVVDGTMREEYARLLEARFVDLDSDQQERVHAAIVRGDPEQDAKRRERRNWTSAELEEANAASRLALLTLVADQLSGVARFDYESLVDRFGQPVEPVFVRGVTFHGSGPNSPLSGEEMRKLTPLEVITQVREWEKPADLFEASPEGLGRVLQSAVADNPSGYIAQLEDVKAMEPTYVRGVLNGLEDATKNGLAFDWKLALDLCDWVVARPPIESAEVRDSFYEDPDWRGSRQAVARLIEAGLTRGEAQLDVSEREPVWKLIETLVSDRDPAADTESDDSFDPATRSINSINGNAMHAVMRYLMWLERNAPAGAFGGMAEAPEVRDLLEAHLDPTVDPSLAIRSVYGQWFPQLVRIDEDWAARLAAAVFPIDGAQDEFFAAAWDAYVVFNQAWTDVHKLTGDAYDHAISRVSSVGEVEGYRVDNPEEALGDHLMLLYAWGIERAECQLAEFIVKAGAELQGEVIRRAGWALSGSSAGALGPEMQVRVQRSWELFRDAASPSVAKAALASFGSWFPASDLALEWRVEEALGVLELGVHLEPNHSVYDELPSLAETDQLGAVKILDGMVRTDASRGLSLHGSLDDARATLAAALESKSSDARQLAVDLIHLLGAMGLHEFGDLLPPQEPG